MAVSDREVPGEISLPAGCGDRQPGLAITWRYPAQDRIDKAGRLASGNRDSQVDGSSDRGMRLDPHAKQLVGTDPQGVEHGRIDLAQLAVSAHRDDRVIAAL